MSIREAFEQRFGIDQAQALVHAAEEHKNGVHDRTGSDPFKWALCIAIGYQCMEIDGYRQHHGITADFAELKTWIRDHGDLASHDGDIDFISALAGTYDEYMPIGGELA